MATKRRVTEVLNQFKESGADIEVLERELIARAQQGDEEAVAALMHRYIGKIYDHMSRHQSKRFLSGEEEDIIQNSYFALDSALKGYDQNKGKFGPYLDLWLKQSVDRYAVFNSAGMPLTTIRYRQLAQLLSHLSSGLTIEEASEKMGVSVKRLEQIRRAKVWMSSLEETVDVEGTQALIDTLSNEESVEDQVIREFTRADIERWVSQLDQEAQAIVSMYCGIQGHKEDRSFENIAANMTVSGDPWNKERARMRFKKAVGKLKEIALSEEQSQKNLSTVSMFSQSTPVSEENNNELVFDFRGPRKG